MPRDAVSRTANVKRTGRHKWDIHVATPNYHSSIVNLAQFLVPSAVVVLNIQALACKFLGDLFIARRGFLDVVANKFSLKSQYTMHFTCHWWHRSIRNPIFSTLHLIGSRQRLYEKLVVVDVPTLKMARKPEKTQKENPVGCAGEGKQNKGN